MSENKWSEAEVEKATERVCVGGKEAGIDFFTRHPSLGFSVAVGIQCEVNALREALIEILTWQGPGTAQDEGAKYSTWGEAEELCRAALEKSK